MHEMGIAMQIVEIAIDSIPPNLRGEKVERVNLKVGKLSAIVPESLRFCFDVVTRDTPLAGSKLNIEEIPVRARCRDCHFEWTMDGPEFVCKNCQGGTIDIIAGRELDIDSIEIADGEKPDAGQFFQNAETVPS